MQKRSSSFVGAAEKRKKEIESLRRKVEAEQRKAEIESVTRVIREERRAEMAVLRRRQYVVIFFVVGAGCVGYCFFHLMMEAMKSQDSKKTEEKYEKQIKKPGTITRFKLEDVVGMKEAKKAMTEALSIPLMLPHLFGKNGRKSWSGILLYGPPGTGKSMLAEAVAQSLPGVSFLSLSASDIKSKWVGETEQNIQAIFSAAKKHKPCIVFIDEIDSLIQKRGGGQGDEYSNDVGMKTELLVQMEGMGSSEQVVILAATNIPFELDDAFRRRCQKRIYAGLPNSSDRKKLLDIHLKNIKHSITERQKKIIASKTKGFSGADMSNLVKSAAMVPVVALLTTTRFCAEVGQPKYKKVKNFEFHKDGTRTLDREQPTRQVRNENYTLQPCSEYLSETKRHGLELVLTVENLMDISDEDRNVIVPRDVCNDDLETALEHTKATVDENTLGKFYEYREQYGTS